MVNIKRCVYGSCTSDTRTLKGNKNIYFIPFPKPKTALDKCQKWLELCGRLDDFTIKNISGSSFVCSLHFEGGHGPTEDAPDILDFRETPEYKNYKERYYGDDYGHTIVTPPSTCIKLEPPASPSSSDTLSIPDASNLETVSFDIKDLSHFASEFAKVFPSEWAFSSNPHNRTIKFVKYSEEDSCIKMIVSVTFSGEESTTDKHFMELKVLNRTIPSQHQAVSVLAHYFTDQDVVPLENVWQALKSLDAYNICPGVRKEALPPSASSSSASDYSIHSMNCRYLTKDTLCDNCNVLKRALNTH